MEHSKRRFLKGTCALLAGASGAALLATVNASGEAKAKA
ncbi:MAG: cytochrome c nitrite reductase Fe-S protein, partial [Shewanella sp.]